MRLLTILLASTSVCAALLMFGAFVASVTPDSHRREGLRAETILNSDAPAPVSSDEAHPLDRPAMNRFVTDRAGD
ncbi:hypothetical protein [uncultured Methylobacterium sp.]|uniref:hypothetical protein n=1 Tax=uncultured Methylobacterium sp. TaxID=157278 RepID=UPI002599B39A|nr:hypothetical protein [uncultured Methylobacterium sp.]